MFHLQTLMLTNVIITRTLSCLTKKSQTDDEVREVREMFKGHMELGQEILNHERMVIVYMF